MSKIAVIGTGYVGLTTGACFAHLGHEVICADIDEEKVARLQRGEIPILEKGLEQLVREGIDAGRLRFVVGAATAAQECEFSYLSVPTPQAADGSADLSYIEAAAREIGPVLPADAIVVNKSTVPVGSTRVVERALGRADVHVVSNPEFLREGSAVQDFLHPDRVVIGADDQSAAVRVASLYVGVPAPLMVTDPASAETIKYASNAFLAAKLSFVNAVANVCEAVGADVNDVVLGMGYDKRIGSDFLRPGPGWGGSCFTGEETVLVRHDGGPTRLLTFSALAAEVDETGPDGWEVQAWAFDEPTPRFFRVGAFTRRPYQGDVVELRTKMGRRLRVTADHPMVTTDGVDAEGYDVVQAGLLTTGNWLPVAQGASLPLGDPPATLPLVRSSVEAGIPTEQVIVRMDAAQQAAVGARSRELPASRRRDVLRNGTLRLSELDLLDVGVCGGRYGTVNNGTFVPAEVPCTPELLRVLGLYLAEGHVGADGRRRRVAWSFHPDAEQDLVDAVVDFWRSVGVEPDVRRLSTTRQVSISSRLLACWIEEVLRLGTSSYDKALPDLVWELPNEHKRALLRGLWDGDGSWSLVAGGPSVVLEYGTVSRALADGMLRLLGGLGIVARLKVGRPPKSTVDTYFLSISGADQVDDALFLFPDDEAAVIRAHVAGQQKRIRPTGYRRLSKGAAWVRVTDVRRERFSGTVHSLEVPGAHTVVTTHGLVAHNCFPKDTRALIRIAEDAGYDFDLLKGVIRVNDEQFERTAAKVVRMAGGSVDGTRIGVWGLTFKAGTDDLRESPAIEILQRLAEHGAQVRAYDPAVEAAVDGLDVEVVGDAYAAADGAEVLVVLTEWDEFKWLDLDKVRDAMAVPQVIDARNLLDRSALLRRGFAFEGIGRA